MNDLGLVIPCRPKVNDIGGMVYYLRILLVQLSMIFSHACILILHIKYCILIFIIFILNKIKYNNLI